MFARTRCIAVALPLALTALAAAPSVDAFCGFYVTGEEKAALFNNATMVVLMREGTRTVLSMQNNYQGPPESFAMVVPVPVVLQKENVKTLPRDVFDKIDNLAAPRLVEYWEQDPCAPPVETKPDARSWSFGLGDDPLSARGGFDTGVMVEAQFTVGEYEVVILSARDSLGLDTWLRQEKYVIPPGSEPLLRPYVQSGAKFFVAKVDPKKVHFRDGMAQLSPLRFHYDSEAFALPVRLGLVNSPGTQDLIVHILARGQRYEAANYANVAIPTNIDVKDSVRSDFGAFYAALFDRTLSRNPGAVITEYAWDAGTCDPCPGPGLDGNDLATFGQDVLDPDERPNAPRSPRRGGWGEGSSFVLTRMHLRYGKGSLGEDLVFRAASAIAGGREFLKDGTTLETGAVTSETNQFQGRYAIRHPWTGPVACKKPRRGIWGGTPLGPMTQAEAAQDLAFATRGGDLAAMLKRDNPETKIDTSPLISMPAIFAGGSTTNDKSATDQVEPPQPQASEPRAGGCAGCRVGADYGSAKPAALGMLAALSFLLARAARRSKND